MYWEWLFQVLLLLTAEAFYSFSAMIQLLCAAQAQKNARNRF